MGPLIRYDSCPELTNAEQYIQEMTLGLGLFKTLEDLRRSPFTHKDEKKFKITITIEEVVE